VIGGVTALLTLAQASGVSDRAQLGAVIVSVILLAFVLELVRRRQLAERYALLWILATLALLVLAIWRSLLGDVADLLGIETPANALFVIALAVTFLLLLHFSVVSSRLAEETKILAQEVARLRQQLGAAQDETATRNGDPSAGGGRAAASVSEGRRPDPPE